MLEELTEKFGETRVNPCLSSDERDEFLITENENTKTSYIVLETDSVEEDKCLKVKNEHQITIYHIAVDNCFLTISSKLQLFFIYI